MDPTVQRGIKDAPYIANPKLLLFGVNVDRVAGHHLQFINVGGKNSVQTLELVLVQQFYIDGAYIAHVMRFVGKSEPVAPRNVRGGRHARDKIGRLKTRIANAKDENVLGNSKEIQST